MNIKFRQDNQSNKVPYLLLAITRIEQKIKAEYPDAQLIQEDKTFVCVGSSGPEAMARVSTQELPQKKTHVLYIQTKDGSIQLQVNKFEGKASDLGQMLRSISFIVTQYAKQRSGKA